MPRVSDARKLNIYLPREDLERLREECRKRERSLSWFIRQAVKKLINQMNGDA
jgi:predicted DNA-binding protein